jgi:CheY-like chemotaxis protein
LLYHADWIPVHNMNLRVLVVDDNPTNLKLACDILQTAGYEVMRAVNADEALAIVRIARLDVILMDIELPGMDGLSLTRMLKADEATRSIPIIALTAFAMKGDEARALQAGCNGYITKPIDTRKFPVQIAGMLQKAKIG